MDNKPTQALSNRNTDQLSKLSIFQNSSELTFVYKKTEKLSTALYMITNFIKDEELIKSQIRSKALGLISVNISLCSATGVEQGSLIKKYEALVAEILALCGIARHVGFISEMNFSVLKNEFEIILSTIIAEKNKLFGEDNSMLSTSFFNIESVPGSDLPKTNLTTTSLKKETSISSPHKVHQNTVDSSRFIKDKRTYGAVEEKKTGRREVILGILKKKQGLNIKDFSKVISGCSEKTIQRELLAMVADGSLRKEGERRWSHYYTV